MRWEEWILYGLAVNSQITLYSTSVKYLELILHRQAELVLSLRRWFSGDGTDDLRQFRDLNMEAKKLRKRQH